MGRQSCQLYREIEDKEIQNEVEKNCKLIFTRYTGTLVADIHRVLLNGGIFLYPEDKYV